MSFFDTFKGKNKMVKKELLDLPYNYDGYDVVFKKGITNPELYSKFNNIITNNKLFINDMAEYQTFLKSADDDSFNIFYDAWIKKLLDNKFVILLDRNVNITNFVNGINDILRTQNENIKIDVNEITDKYNNELKTYTYNSNEIEDVFNYDILEANIVADELRKNGYELICLFNGYDNNIKTFVRIEDIEKLKDIEQKIKETDSN